MTELKGRMCNGVYLWKITEYARHLENARDNVVTALYSPPFYTNFYGYKFCLRYVDSIQCRKVLSHETFLLFSTLWLAAHTQANDKNM